jgi:myosin-6
MDGGRQVWAPHPVHGFVLGTIIDLGNDTLTVRPAAAGGEPITATYDRVFPAIDETVKAVEDNCGLMYLNEATLLNNIRARYEKDLIYVSGNKNCYFCIHWR